MSAWPPDFTDRPCYPVLTSHICFGTFVSAHAGFLFTLRVRRRVAGILIFGFSRDSMVDGEATTGAEDSILKSWSEIARYMGKGVRTVQRWEQDFGLPVHRDQNCPRKAILAHASELDAWAIHCCETRSARSGVTAAIPPSIRKRAEESGRPGQPDQQSGFRARPVLTSWKEIAQYLGCGVRTVQRWESDFGLPVRRPLGFPKKAILARPCEVEKWLDSWSNYASKNNRADAMRAPINSISPDGNRSQLADASAIGISSITELTV